jgi:hypothetical protein
MQLTELRAQFEAGLRDDKCVMVLPHVGIALLDVIGELTWINPAPAVTK